MPTIGARAAQTPPTAEVPSGTNAVPETLPETPAGPAAWVHREGLTAAGGRRRVLLTVSYEGTAYAGWQRQINGVAVQQRLEEALRTLTGERIAVTGASRTDAGVHALGQRAHFDTGCTIPADRFPYALNTHLPPDIRVLEGREVDAGFHARFDAKGKTYLYRIHNAPHADALLRNLTAHVPVPLDLPAMRAALAAIPGTHDFAAFEASAARPKPPCARCGKRRLRGKGRRSP
jgi:tRNA pseudouridine38-40 synthase